MKNNKAKLEIKYSPSLIKDACQVAEQMVIDGKNEGPLFKNLSVFVDKRPPRILFIIPLGELPETLVGKKIYVGCN